MAEEPRPPARRLFEPAVEDDVGRELRFHIEMKTEELIAAGWSGQSARAEAARRFGNMRDVEEECMEIAERNRRAARRANRLESVWQDVRFGVRTLVSRPAFAILAVTTLALGIGANTAIFSVIDAVLLKPLPYPDADRLVALWEVGERGNEMHAAGANFVDWRDQNSSFEGLATYPSYAFGGPTTVLGGDRPARVWAASVSGDFFRLLGVAPVLGRTFTPEEATADAPPVAIVSYEFWRNELGGERDLSSRTLRAYSASVSIIGVMPPGFHFPKNTDIWVADAPEASGPYRTSHNYAVLGRLKDGVPIQRARDEMNGIQRRIRERYGDDANAVGVSVTPLQEELVGSFRQPLLLLLGAAALVLLVACTNLASALLARASARQTEMAVRSSLGASRHRLIRQLLTESVLLAVLGAAAGLAVAFAALRVLSAIGPARVLGGASVSVSGGVLVFTLVLSLASVTLFGLFPAFRISQRDVVGALREGGHGTGDRGHGRAWNGLVVSEVALALVLLVGSGLLIESFWRVMAIDPGFQASHVLTADVSLPSSLYPNDTIAARYWARALPVVAALPGVERAGIVSSLPMGGSSINGGFDIEGGSDAGPYADYRVASEDYFAAMGIPIARGRAFTEADGIGAPQVAIVNQVLADRYFPDGDAVGRRIRDLANDSWYYRRDVWITIVGVVGNVRHGGLLSEPRAEVYVPYRQRAMRATSAIVVVRANGEPAALTSSVREAITRLDANVPVELQTMASRVSDSVADRRFAMVVLGAFAALALVLSAVGIYGVVSYSVARRRREMGIRLALGAAPGGVLGMVVRDAMVVIASGIFLGLAGAFAATRLLSSMLYGVGATDPATFAVVALVLACVGGIAAWLPARRTARIDPMLALRAD